MRICDRGINFVQIMNAEGACRSCSWTRNNYIGSLLKDDIKTIMRSNEAVNFRKPLLDGTYTNCDADNCPYMANGNMEDVLIDISDIPEYPSTLLLAYEGICNYNCTCCTSYEHMEATKRNDYTEQYSQLEEKLKVILPHIKCISANGRGELFVSKRILKLLSEWKPLAPKEEISVMLETNGSLFDEKHWKEIENLGQYNLSVTISIMSFDEQIYQHLSGTRLPISRIEDNLRFVRKLREQGVINYLQLATVLQEENFRQMPEFARRCIEDFGADRVRIRPIFPGGIYDNNIQWFMDVRNPEHPYYQQYVRTMQHPIFKHPKVLLWSGDIDSSIGKHPGIKSAIIQKTMERILNESEFMDKLVKIIGTNRISLYGIGTIGKLLVRLNEGQVKIEGIYDSFSNLNNYMGFPIRRICDDADKSGVVIVMVYDNYQQIMKELRNQGFIGEIIHFYSILEKMN